MSRTDKRSKPTDGSPGARKHRSKAGTANQLPGTPQALIYVRVSSEEQARGYSLPTQEELCREYAAKCGYTVVDVIADSHTGESLDRKGLSRLFEFVAVHPIDVVIVYDLDRLSRGGPPHCAIIEAHIEKHGARLEYVRGDYNGNSPEATLSKLIKQSISWYENQQRRERSMRGRLGAVKAGRILVGARVPYGYRYLEGRLEIEAAEAEVVRRIFAWLASGWSANRVAAQLSAEGILTRADTAPVVRKRNAPGVWHATSVTKIIKNPVYTGRWYYNKRKSERKNGKAVQVPRPQEEWQVAQVPPIIEQSVFDQAQAQLAANKINATRNTKREYLLQSHLYCHCGRRCDCNADARTHSRYYLCPNRRHRHWDAACTLRFSARTEALDTAVWESVTNLLLNPSHLRTWIAAQRENARTKTVQYQERLAAIAAAQAEVARKLGLLLDNALTLDFPRAVVEERRRLLADQMHSLQAEERQAAAALALLSLTEDNEKTLLKVARQLQRGIDKLDFAARREVLRLLKLRVDILDAQTVRISALLPLDQDRMHSSAQSNRAAGLCIELNWLQNAAHFLATGGPAPVTDGATQ